jgi:hypothetical protein
VMVIAMITAKGGVFDDTEG